MELTRITKNINKLFYSLILYSFLLIISFLLISCSRCPKSCSDNNDCTRDYCSEETRYECINEEIQDCHCGNNVCEEELGENKCTCVKDCGTCKGKVSEYVEYRCVNDECVSAVKEDIEVKPVSKILNQKIGDVTTTLKLEYDEPLNTELSRLKIILRPEDIPEKVKDFKITRFIMLDDQKTFISELEVNKKLTKIGESLGYEMSFKGYKFDEKKNKRGIRLVLDIFYEYILVSGTRETQKRSNRQVKFGPIIFTTAQAGQKTCPDTCNDGIDCTKDYCSEETGYGCVHELIPNCVCGNEICEKEKGENKCNCEKDCGICGGDVTEFVEYRCFNSKCMTAVKETLEIKPVSEIDVYDKGDFKYSLKLDYEDPINTELTKLNVKFTLENIKERVQDLAIVKARLIDDKNNFISEVEVDDKIKKIGNTVTFNLPLKNYIYDEERNQKTGTNLILDIYFHFEYESGSETQEKRPNYEIKFGPVKFIKAEAGQET